MATETNTSIDTYVQIKKIDIPEDGLYSIVKIFNDKKTSDRIDGLNGLAEKFDNYHKSINIEKCEYWDVYVKPANGSRISSVMNEGVSTSQSNGTGFDGTPWEVPPSRHPNPDEEEWSNVYPVPSCKNMNTNQIDYKFGGTGGFYIGVEYEEKWTETTVHTYIHEDWEESENLTSTSYYETVITDMYMIEGETNYIDVKVIGNQSADKFIYYSYDLDNDTRTYILRVTPSKQTYTNIVAFNEKYEMGGSGLPSYFTVCNPGSSGKHRNITMSKTFDVLDNQTTIYTGLLESESSELDVFEHIYDSGSSNENKIKSMLIYVDCAFAVFSPAPYGQEGDEMHGFYSTYKESEKYEKPYIEQQGVQNCLRLIPCYELLMRSTDSDKYLYLSYKDFTNCRFETRVSNPLENIPTEHRWIQLLGLGMWDRLTGYNAIVRLVDKNTQETISDIVDVEDGYVRYAKYWYVESCYNRNDWVLEEDQILSGTLVDKIENRIYYPIVKPWAAVHMNVFPEQRNNEPFGVEREYNWTYEAVKLKLDKYFETTTLNPTCYYREIDIDADSNISVVQKKIRKYYRIVSPFRVETFTCHGSRKEYDEGSQELDGRDYISIAKKEFGKFVCDNLHNRIDKYNASIFSNEHMYWNVMVESCFGQGIKTEQTRRNDITTNFISSTGDILPGRANAFVTIGAVGTHCDYGNSTGWGVGSSFMCKLMSDTITYQELSDNFNNLVKQCKEQAFQMIRDFYNNNFSEMLFCLKDESTRQEWIQTKSLISEDLTNDNQGRKYFVQYDWNRRLRNGNPHPCYTASDNYFAIPGNYRINDGFIGLIKDAMCPALTNLDDKWKCFRKFDDPEGMEIQYEEMVDKCIDDIKQCGRQIKDLYRNALTTRYYDRLASISAIVEPRMFVSGKLANAKFLDYPEEEAEMKKWLTSDDDLYNLCLASTEE